MTKIRNTKKGMAKKTLSISLAVAMLATSNVPVWAAEDLFTNGEVAVEAFTADEEATVVEEEAPVVADAVEEEVPVATIDTPTVDSRYSVEFKDLPSEMEWNEAKDVQLKVYDNIEKRYVTNDSSIKVRYLDTLGQLEGINGDDFTITAGAAADDYGTFHIDFKNWVKEDPSIVGKSFRLQVYNTSDENESGYADASSAIKLNKVTLKGNVSLLGNPTHLTEWDKVVYTGHEITTGPALKTGLWDTNKNGIQWTKTGDFVNFPLAGELDNKNCVIEGLKNSDITNTWNISKNVLTSTVNIVDDLYRGDVVITFAIEPKVVTTATLAENIGITLAQKEYEYTGDYVYAFAKDAVVTDLNSGKTIANALHKDSNITFGKEVGEYENVKAWLDLNAPTLGNFSFDIPNDAIGLAPRSYAHSVTGTYKVVKRDLTNTDSTIIKIKHVNNESLINGAFVDAAALRDNNLTIIDARTGQNITDTLAHAYKLTLASNPLPVEIGKSYTATIETTNENLVTGKREVSFKVVGHDLSDARVDNEEFLSAPVKYTGSQITKNVTKENFEKTVGVVEDFNTTINNWVVLSKDFEYSTTPEFGENLNAYTANTNVGLGQIIINGAGTFEGTEKVIEFNIVPREASKLNVPASVPFDSNFEKATDYDLAAQTTVTASFKDEWTNEKKTLTVPETDYVITYTCLDENKAVVSAPVKGGYIRTTVKAKAGVKSNFSNIAFEADTKLTKRELTTEHVILNKDSYVYTGKEATVDYKVVYNGETLVKGTDYDTAIINGTNVGTGTLVVTGKGDYEESAVRVNFAITPAKTSDVKVTHNKDCVYNGEQHNHAKSELKIELNGVDVSADFKVSYPSSKLANINAGDGEIILTPANKNFDAVGTSTFVIKPATLTGGDIKAYNEKESLVKWYREDGVKKEFVFNYDGTAKSYAKTLFKAAPQGGKKVVTDSDYEIKYIDNVAGKRFGTMYGIGHALVIAKGNYVGAGTYTCEDGTIIKNVVADESFLIERREIHKSNVVVENGAYRGGKDVEPVVSINYNGKKLVQGQDFALEFVKTENRKDVTNGKTLNVTVVGKGGYYLDATETFKFTWGIDAFDLANAELIVKGTDANPYVKVLNGSVVVDPDEYDLTIADGKVTVTAKKTSTNYVGTQTTDIKEALEKPGKPVIAGYEVVGNKVTVVLEDDVEGAIGYDFVIDTKSDCTDTHNYYQVSKNNLKTNATFTYVDQNIYYAYCHAYTRDENGKKVFGEWSEPKIFSVSAITPETPSIEKFTVKGNTVTVTYTKANAADGYDVVLGTTYGTVLGERRPLQYGELVKKNIKGDTVTAVFKNVPKGTYYAGLHAFNRTSEDGKKVFSPWSNIRTIRVK